MRRHLAGGGVACFCQRGRISADLAAQGCPDLRVGTQVLVRHQQRIGQSGYDSAKMLIHRNPQPQPIVQPDRIAVGRRPEQERAVGCAKFMVPEPGHVLPGKGIGGQEPLVLRRQTLRMLQWRTDRHQKQRGRHRLRQLRQPQDLVVVLGQIPVLAGAAQHKADQIQIA